MRTLNQWLDAYGVSHQNPTNKLIHKICVPAIMFSLLGLLWAIPTPAFMINISPWFNWAFVFVLVCLIFYLTLDFKMFLGMLGLCALMTPFLKMLAASPYLVSGSVAIFVIAWIGQFIGHKIEGKKPSFFEDLLFL